MLRSEQDMLLDDATPADLERALGVEVRFCGQSGAELLRELTSP